MGRFRSQILVSMLILVVATIVAASCAGPPLRVPGRLDRDAGGAARDTAVLMTAVVVDTTAAGGTLAVKDVQSHETWTVTTTPETRVYGEDGGRIKLDDVEIGARVQIRGDSRIPLVVEAAEVDVQEDPFHKKKDQEALPR